MSGDLKWNKIMAAGLATLRELESTDAFARLEHAGARLESGMKAVAAAHAVPMQFQRIGSMFCGYFTDRPVWNLNDALTSDRTRFGKFFHAMLDNGVYLAPSAYEAGFVSSAHGPAEIKQTLAAARESFTAVA